MTKACIGKFSRSFYGGWMSPLEMINFLRGVERGFSRRCDA